MKYIHLFKAQNLVLLLCLELDKHQRYLIIAIENPFMIPYGFCIRIDAERIGQRIYSFCSFSSLLPMS